MPAELAQHKHLLVCKCFNAVTTIKVVMFAVPSLSLYMKSILRIWMALVFSTNICFFRKKKKMKSHACCACCLGSNLNTTMGSCGERSEPVLRANLNVGVDDKQYESEHT